MGVVLGATDRVYIPCLMHGTRLCNETNACVLKMQRPITSPIKLSSIENS